MKLREFCETALSNDLVGFIDDISDPKAEPEKAHACYRLLMENSPLLDREIDRFTYGKVKCANRQAILIQLKEQPERVGTMEFKRRIEEKLLKINSEICRDDLYYTQTLHGYSIDYKPNYPMKSNADFQVYQGLDGKITLRGNFDALIPTVLKFENIDAFENDL